MLETRHLLVSEYGYTLYDIDEMYPFELEITTLMIVQIAETKKKHNQG